MNVARQPRHNLSKPSKRIYIGKIDMIWFIWVGLFGGFFDARPGTWFKYLHRLYIAQELPTHEGFLVVQTREKILFSLDCF